MRCCVAGFAIALVGSCAVEGTPDNEDEVEELAAKRGPSIASVATSDGFTQLRQNAVVSIVIRGKKLGGATAVTVGTTAAQIDSVANRVIHATVFTYGVEPLGPLDVTVETPGGTATRAGALELTPFVVSPTATAGHGTFQSPMALCDPELEQTGTGTTVLVLAGTHHCGRVIGLGGGTTVLGDAAGGTTVTGTAEGGFGIEIFNAGNTTTTTFRDLAFVAPLAESSITSGLGRIDIGRVTDAGGIRHYDAGFAIVDHYTFEGPGAGLDLFGGDITSSTFRNCGVAIEIGAATSTPGSATLDGVVVEGCSRGLTVGNLSTFPHNTVDVAHSRFDTTDTGIRLEGGNLTLTDVAIHAATVGASVPDGLLVVRGGELAGHSRAGIEVVRPFGGGNPFPSSRINLADLAIAGGQYGVFFSGLDNSLIMRRTTVRDQTVASVYVSAVDSSYDLGTAGNPGDNALSVVSGFALDDQRNDCPIFSQYLDAAGTTLNGVDFAGQTIEAPAALAPHYRTAVCGIQF